MGKNFLKKWGVSGVAILVGSLIIFVALTWFRMAVTDTVEQSIHENMIEVADNAAQTLSNELRSYQDMLKLQAKMIGAMGQPADDVVMGLLREMAMDPRFVRLTLVNADGKAYSSTFGVQQLEDFMDIANFGSGETLVGSPRRDTSGIQAIDISTPVYQNGKIVGRLIATIDQKILRSLYSTNALKGDAALCLASGEGTVIATFSKRSLPIIPGDSVYTFSQSNSCTMLKGTTEEYKSNIQAHQSGWLKYRMGDNQICLYYQPIEINDWSVSITATDATLLHQSGGIQRLAIQLTLWIVVVMLVVSAVVLFQRVREQRRIDAMKNTYSVAIRKTNDLFYEADIDNDKLVDYSESSDKAIWRETPKNYSDALSQIADVCSPEYRQEFLDTFLPRNIKIKIQEGISYINFEYKIKPDEQTTRWFSATFVPIIDGKHSTKLICMENDITEDKLRQERLHHSAAVDSLTGLYNRATTEQYINDYFVGEGAQGGHAFLIIDIDYFKMVNDTLGHAKGDQVLAEYSDVLRRIFRQGDIVGRIGGDEFVVLMKDCSDLNKVLAKAAEVGNGFRHKQFKEEEPRKQVQTSASIGIALYQDHGKDFKTLYKNADTALYASKNAGRDQATVYEKEEEPTE